MNTDQYFKANVIYFLVAMSLILFISAGLPTKIKVWLIAKYPYMEECLESEEERDQRLARIARAQMEAAQEEQRRLQAERQAAQSEERRLQREAR